MLTGARRATHSLIPIIDTAHRQSGLLRQRTAYLSKVYQPPKGKVWKKQTIPVLYQPLQHKTAYYTLRKRSPKKQKGHFLLH